MDTNASEDVGEACTQNFPPGMAPKMRDFLTTINDLETDLEALISQPYHEALNKLSPMERAKVGMMEIYTINSLFWVLMKASGEDSNPALREDYKVEMGRLKEAQGRISEVEARAHRRPVDTEAAARFIRRGLGISGRRREAEGNDE